MLKHHENTPTLVVFNKYLIGKILFIFFCAMITYDLINVLLKSNQNYIGIALLGQLPL